ncbi:MAG: L-histidine N(alpha)-methyltransferase, partial [Daejeonella sp.]|uniref:L-histidine N(alpha)-methyltransferase n=1 Tax=Daejeonella sp. TaxID=2805397 RepID=UPI003C70DDED
MNTDLNNCPTIEADINLVDKLRQEVIAGLTSTSKTLPSKYLYDQTGDRLFQEIMKMPEYYLTNCELDIFKNRTAELASIVTKGAQPFDLIEMGAGDASKSSFLLKYLI